MHTDLFSLLLVKYSISGILIFFLVCFWFLKNNEDQLLYCVFLFIKRIITTIIWTN
jgi:hypothetical protein